MTARPRPTLANWSETCDWGHCNGQSYAVRWADHLGLPAVDVPARHAEALSAVVWP